MNCLICDKTVDYSKLTLMEIIQRNDIGICDRCLERLKDCLYPNRKLEEHENAVYHAISIAEVPSGVACPQCKEELYRNATPITSSSLITRYEARCLKCGCICSLRA